MFKAMLNAPATGLALLMLLALGTFVAGVHVSWHICALGIAMALFVPAIAWLAEFCSVLGLGGRSSYPGRAGGLKSGGSASKRTGSALSGELKGRRMRLKPAAIWGCRLVRS